MAQYTPKTWTTGETITAAELNAIEGAAAAAAVKADADAAYDAKGAATAAQAAAVQRANHTGTQSADSLVDGTTNKAYTAAEKTKLAGVATGATAYTDTQAQAANAAALAAKANTASLAPAATIAALRAFPYPGMVPAFNGTSPNNQGTTSTNQGATYNHRYIAVDDVFQVAPVFPNYTANADGTNPITISATVSNDAGVNRRRLSFNGQTTATISVSGEVVADPYPLEVAKGGTIEVNVFVSVGTAGQSWPLGHVSQGASSGLTDNSGTTGFAWQTANGSYGYGPTTILATTGTRQTKLVALVGDSIMNGEHDNPTTQGGFETGLLAANLCSTKVSLGGETMQGFAGYGTRRRRTKYITGATHILCQYGTNDLGGQRTTAQLAADAIGLWKTLALMGAKVTQTTTTPRTSSTDTWATTTNQTPVAGCGQPRLDWNNWLRAGAPIDPTAKTYVVVGTAGALTMGQAGHPLTSILEIADLVESARDSGVWAVGMVNTADGIHPSTTAHTGVIKTAVTNWANSLT